MRFEFCDQIWNPPIILHMLGFYLFLFSHFYFLTYHIFKILQIARAVNFFRNRFFNEIRNQRPNRHNNGWCGDWFAEKNGDHNLT